MLRPRGGPALAGQRSHKPHDEPLKRFSPPRRPPHSHHLRLTRRSVSASSVTDPRPSNVVYATIPDGLPSELEAPFEQLLGRLYPGSPVTVILANTHVMRDVKVGKRRNIPVVSLCNYVVGLNRSESANCVVYRIKLYQKGNTCFRGTSGLVVE